MKIAKAKSKTPFSSGQSPTTHPAAGPVQISRRLRTALEQKANDLLKHPDSVRNLPAMVNLVTPLAESGETVESVAAYDQFTDNFTFGDYSNSQYADFVAQFIRGWLVTSECGTFLDKLQRSLANMDRLRRFVAKLEGQTGQGDKGGMERV